MKKLFFILVLTTIVLTSCSQEEDVLYSCNEEINEWVIENKEIINQMNRDDLLKMDPAQMRATYRAFSQKQKIEYWEASIEETLLLDWSDAEVLHIRKVKEFIKSHTNFFRGEPLEEAELDELEIFFYQWLEYAKENFGWTNKIGIAIAGTGYSLKNKAGDINISTTSFGSSTSSCDCNDGVVSDFCLGGICTKVKCLDTYNGCGWLQLQKCNGMCGPKLS